MIRFSVPTGTPDGPRIRRPRRKNIGVLAQSLIVTPVKVMSSRIAPSTVSNAKPRQPSNTQLEIVMFLKPPFDSVPHLMRPVGLVILESACQRFQGPSRVVPSSYAPVT